MTTPPVITVGIVTARVVDFEGEFDVPGSDESLRGPSRASVSGHSILIECGGTRSVHPSGVLLARHAAGSGSFLIRGVTIGARFHWERKEDQRFTGSLRLAVKGDAVVAINVVPVEEYLSSVISSEMGAGSPASFLKAHAIASRSWLLAQIDDRGTPGERPVRPPSTIRGDGTLLRWYDREEHDLFDVCADDHCQRYYGITKSPAPAVRDAVAGTRGCVLMHGERICDARFSKSCGGITEPFANVWQGVDVPYLASVADIAPEERLPAYLAGPDASREDLAARWIRSAPDAFCNTADGILLSQVLAGVDRETKDFYRWSVEYGQDYLAALVKEKTGVEFGPICDIVPVRRGPSGRLELLRIVGQKRTLTIGKELEIRRTLSPSHLYSSAFVVDRLDLHGAIPGRFVFTGAGWGHGVGLCQIGAAVMGDRGYPPEAILAHYYRGASVVKLY